MRCRPSRLIHFLPSLTDVVFLLPVLLLYGTFNGPSFMLGDGDTGWHLRTGEWILANRRVPTTDLFSFTMPGRPWFAWEWLWDLGFGWLHTRFGMAAVTLASLFIIATTFALVYRLAFKKSGNPLVAAGVVSLAVVASSIHWLARPHLVTLLFTVLFGLILERCRTGSGRCLWALPFLMVLWTNLHGGFFVGLILIGTYAAGEICSWVLEKEVIIRQAALERAKQYVLCALGCAAATLVNPYGFHLHAHIGRYLTERYHLDRIQEFQSLSFHHPIGPVVAALLMFGTMSAFWHLTRKRCAEPLLLLGWSWLALVATRNIPIYGVVASPLIASALAEMLGRLGAATDVSGWAKSSARRLHRLASDMAALEAPWRLHLASLGVFTVLIFASFRPASLKLLRSDWDAQRFPVRAFNELPTPVSAHRIFTTDTWGGYLIYRSYPDIRVFVDGRSDFYGPQFGENWGRIFSAGYDWQSQLNKFGVDTVLLPVNASVVGALKESRRWRPVYDDGVAIVFRAVLDSNFQAQAAAPAGPSRRGRTTGETINFTTNNYFTPRG